MRILPRKNTEEKPVLFILSLLELPQLHLLLFVRHCRYLLLLMFPALFASSLSQACLHPGRIAPAQTELGRCNVQVKKRTQRHKSGTYTVQNNSRIHAYMYVYSWTCVYTCVGASIERDSCTTLAPCSACGFVETRKFTTYA